MEGGTQYLNLFMATLVILSITSHSLAYLSTNGRWLVSPSGERVKLRCVSWTGHLYAMVPEGLNKQPLKSIAEQVNRMGFNCVRLTWATHMYTRDENKYLTVEKSLIAWHLEDARDGIQKNNPSLLTMTLADAQTAVIDELGANNLMVVLDNHVSEPIWCCSSKDGNGFYGDTFFDGDEWLKAWRIVVRRYKGNPTVVGVSMRNELRGPGQNETTWYDFMEEGATMIHNENPDVLVIVSGLSFATDLHFLKNNPLIVRCPNKLVFEAHMFMSYSDPIDRWMYQTNEFCGNKTKNSLDQSGFLIKGGAANSTTFPLFISAFGVDLLNPDKIMDNFLTCTLAYIAEYDFDWGLWALQGSLMLRDGQHDVEDNYGILSKDWGNARSPDFMMKLKFIQQINLGTNPQQTIIYKLFHPQTGRCVQSSIELISDTDNVYLTDCQDWQKWSHEGDGSPIKLADGRCLIAVGNGLAVNLTDDCTNKRAAWNFVSGSKLHIANKDEKGSWLCLHPDNSDSFQLVTRKCLCVDENNNDLPQCDDNPTQQWFKFVPFNTEG